VESQLGAGSTFSLCIPVQYKDSETEIISAPVELVSNSAADPVLIVEDESDLIMIYKNYLQDSGFHVMAARTTAEAEALLERIRPRLIILDILLRWEDSWGFLARLKNDSRSKDIPVLVISTLEDEAKGYHLGADKYLVKPVGRLSLVKEVHVLTGQAAPAHVLIIDNQKRDRYLLKQALKNLPVIVSETSSAVEGLRDIRQHRPDLIFLDLEMPEMNGFETLATLKATLEWKDVPVVIVTSQVLSEGERAELMKSAVAIFNKKDLDPREIARVLRRNWNGANLSMKAG